MILRIVAIALLAATPAAAQSPAPAQSETRASSLQSALASLPHPAAAYLVGLEGEFGAAVAPLTPETPLRVASNTKTFVAATVLRLWEQGRIDLDAPIAKLIAPAYDRALTGDGFDTNKITVRHLLSQSGGLYDDGSDKRFIESLHQQPKRKWTRGEQVQASMAWGDPLGPPPQQFRYSDTGYILLGDIIERVTRRSLAKAVRQQLKLDSLGLKATWWEVLEKAPRTAPPRGRQFLGDTDVTDVDPSMDLYGGGGLVMSPRDLALFMRALFGGRIFVRPETLREMLRQGPHKGGDTYRLGIFVKQTSAGEIWWHTGFWGTYAAYAPSTGRAIAGMSDHQAGLKPLIPLLEAALFEKAVR